MLGKKAQEKNLSNLKKVNRKIIKESTQKLDSPIWIEFYFGWKHRMSVIYPDG